MSDKALPSGRSPEQGPHVTGDCSLVQVFSYQVDSVYSL